ncbi:hypothetical protein [Haliscomenobacter sp.]|uniref:hypothetical protein n=1 Tax=Haliscomenobacter sp. TaxID=2717303 RepID=UPI003BAD33EF
MDNSNALFEVLSFSEDNLAKAFSNEHTSIEYIKGGKYHFNFLFDYLKYRNRPSYKVKTILIEHKYISQTYLSDLPTEFIFSSQDQSKLCKRVHFFSRSFITVEELLADPENANTKKLWDSYKGFATVKPLPKSRLGPVILSPYPSSGSADRKFTAIRPYNINLLGRSIHLNSLAFMEQDGILHGCATVALWSAIHRLHSMFNVGMLHPMAINTLAKYTTRSQLGAITGVEMNLHQICGVIEQMGLKAELRTMIGSLEHNVNHDEKEEIGYKTFVCKFIYSYLKMGLPILLGLEFEDGGKHLITLIGYKAINDQKANFTKHNDWPIAYADQIQTLYAHDDLVGPFSKLTLMENGSKVKVIPLKDPTGKIARSESNVHSIIVPLPKEIRLTFEDIYQQTLYFESLFYELIETDQNFVWDIYLLPSSEYRRDIVKTENTYSQAQKTELLTRFLPPYLWVARANVTGYPEMEFIFDATAAYPYNDFCIDVMFFDEVLERLIKMALTIPEQYEIDTYSLIYNVYKFIDGNFNSAYVWSIIKNKLIGKTKFEGNEPKEDEVRKDEVEKPQESSSDINIPFEENQITDVEEHPILEKLKENWVEMISKDEVRKDEVEKPQESSSDINIPFEENQIRDVEEHPTLEKLKENWVEMISKADLDTPLNEIKVYCKKSIESRTREIVLLQFRRNSLRERDIIGTLTFKSYLTENNRIAAALVDFIKSL